MNAVVLIPVFVLVSSSVCYSFCMSLWITLGLNHSLSPRLRASWSPKIPQLTSRLRLKVAGKAIKLSTCVYQRERRLSFSFNSHYFPKCLLSPSEHKVQTSNALSRMLSSITSLFRRSCAGGSFKKYTPVFVCLDFKKKGKKMAKDSTIGLQKLHRNSFNGPSTTVALTKMDI